MSGGGGDEMTNIKQAIDDLIDAADRIVHRRDPVIEGQVLRVALVPTQSVLRLERAITKAQDVVCRLDEQEDIVYLASPYSHPDPRIREERYGHASYMAAMLMRDGRLVYSPIVHSHPLTRLGLPTTWDYWRTLDEAMLSRCQELLVLTLDGWENSEGVMAEIRLARKLGIPVRYTGLGNPLRQEDPHDA